MPKKVNILGIKVDKVNIEQASDIIIDNIKNKGETISVFTPNSEIIMAGYRDKDFGELLNNADLLTADGIGVVYASKIVKNPISERAPGYDIACRSLEKLAEIGGSVYLFGSKPGVAETAGENITKKYPGVKIAGFSDGYFDDEKEKLIIEDINKCNPDMLFVCLGAPKQEKWISAHKNELSTRACLGIGGSLDVFAGTVKRAPEFYTKHGIEWLYRLIKQPSRFVRMLELPRFGFKVLLKGKKFPQDKDE
ncbi:MAG: WecB/TagA/CpsF family glycosyltransferase [Clostridia bacterium]|nr:WecB/TagA/CpsF family glycosyltransferase [Clostridia bacterium]